MATISRDSREISIPGDLPRSAALGHVRTGDLTEKMIKRRLDYIEACLTHEACPDVKGKRRVKDERVTYELVPLPSELTAHAKDLKTAVRQCHALLESNELDVARARMKGIEVLVSDMAQRADPDRRCGRKVKEGQSKGGKVRARQVALKKQRTMELLNT